MEGVSVTAVISPRRRGLAGIVAAATLGRLVIAAPNPRAPKARLGKEVMNALPAEDSRIFSSGELLSR
jgi:hypothetical protein